MTDRAKPPVADPGRWHDYTCSRCGATLGTGSTVYNLHTSIYRPMQLGPEWVAVGDWTKPEPAGPILCEPCESAVVAYAMAHLLKKSRKP